CPPKPLSTALAVLGSNLVFLLFEAGVVFATGLAVLGSNLDPLGWLTFVVLCSSKKGLLMTLESGMTRSYGMPKSCCFNLVLVEPYKTIAFIVISLLNNLQKTRDNIMLKKVILTSLILGFSFSHVQAKNYYKWV